MAACGSSWQDERTLDLLRTLLVDPVDRSRLIVRRGDDGRAAHLRGYSGTYDVTGGIPDLRPSAADLRRLLGTDRHDAWAVLQHEAEASYVERVEGHFSTSSWKPAADLAETLRDTDDGRWLDAGCGLLSRPAYLKEIGNKDIVGVDPMGIPARREFPFARALADRLPFRNGVFDGVVLPSSLDHAIAPRAALAEARRTLRSGGTLVVLETLRPDDETYRRWRAAAVANPARYNRWHHWAFVEDDLRRLVASAGFCLTSFERAPSDPREAIVVARRSTSLVGRLSRAMSARRADPRDRRSASYTPESSVTIVPSHLQRLATNWRDETNFPVAEHPSAADYARKMTKRPLSYFVQRIENLGLSGGSVLDAGCGTGTWSFALRATFDIVHGTDYVEDRTLVAEHIALSNGVQGTYFRPGDVMDLPYDDASFDTVFCFGVIIVPQTRLETALREFFRVTRAGGTVHLCLNAIGWAHYLASAEVDSRRELGRNGIYVAVRDRELGPVLPELRDAKPAEIMDNDVGAKVERFAASLSGPAQEAVLRALEAILAGCGAHQLGHLAEELTGLAAGTQREFNPPGPHPRVYEPEEARHIAEATGFTEFRWAPEGQLVVRDPPHDVVSIYKPDFGGRTAVWECLLTKPG